MKYDEALKIKELIIKSKFLKPENKYQPLMFIKTFLANDKTILNYNDRKFSIRGISFIEDKDEISNGMKVISYNLELLTNNELGIFSIILIYNFDEAFKIINNLKEYKGL